MNNEKKLASLFKTFMERTCVALIKAEAKLLKEWLYFSTLISQEFIDFQRLEKYVESLSANSVQSNKQEPSRPTVTDEQLFSDHDGFMKKKLEIVQKYKQTQQSPSFFLHKTYGGERSPLKTLSVVSQDIPFRKYNDLTTKAPFSDTGFSKRLTVLHQLFAENDRRLANHNEDEFKLTDTFEDGIII